MKRPELYPRKKCSLFRFSNHRFFLACLIPPNEKNEHPRRKETKQPQPSFGTDEKGRSRTRAPVQPSVARAIEFWAPGYKPEPNPLFNFPFCSFATASPSPFTLFILPFVLPSVITTDYPKKNKERNNRLGEMSWKTKTQQEMGEQKQSMSEPRNGFVFLGDSKEEDHHALLLLLLLAPPPPPPPPRTAPSESSPRKMSVGRIDPGLSSRPPFPFCAFTSLALLPIIPLLLPIREACQPLSRASEGSSLDMALWSIIIIELRRSRPVSYPSRDHREFLLPTNTFRCTKTAMGVRALNCSSSPLRDSIGFYMQRVREVSYRGRTDRAMYLLVDALEIEHLCSTETYTLCDVDTPAELLKTVPLPLLICDVCMTASLASVRFISVFPVWFFCLF